jgi:uncharacterized protein YbjT (DUF2867 family)
MSKPILAIIGATGNQGNSTAHFVLDSPSLSSLYTVRAISRTTTSPAMQLLASKGAQLARADLDDPTSLPSALENASFLFFMTCTSYRGATREIETRQARALCSAALAQGVTYIIFSSMSHPFAISNGVLKNVEHFDVKAEIETYIRGLPVKSAFFAPGSFMQNFTTMAKPRPSAKGDGTYVLANIVNHDTLIPYVDVTDTGKWIGAMLAEPEKYEWSFFAAASGLITLQEACGIISKVTGKQVRYEKVADEVFKENLPEGMREALYEMWVFIREYGYFGGEMAKKVEWTRMQARGDVEGLEGFLRRVGYTLE